MSPHTSLFSRLGIYLSYAEIAFLIVAAIGLGLNYRDPSQGFQIVTISFSALAAIQFLHAYAPLPMAANDPDAPPKGFIDLLPLILRKVIFIGASVAIIGLEFSIMLRPGSREMLMIGGASLLAGCLLSGLLILRNNECLSILRAPLLRGVPLLLIVAYLKFG